MNDPSGCCTTEPGSPVFQSSVAPEGKPLITTFSIASEPSESLRLTVTGVAIATSSPVAAPPETEAGSATAATVMATLPDTVSPVRGSTNE